MRLLHIITTLKRWGPQRQLALLLSGLPRDQFDVHVCALGTHEPLADDLRDSGIPVDVMGAPRRPDPTAFWRLKKRIDAIKPDVVHTWLPMANRYGRSAAWLSGVRSMVAGYHWYEEGQARPRHIVDRWLDRRTRRVVVNTSELCRPCDAARPTPDRYTVISGGIEVPPSNPLDRGALLAELKLPAATRLIGAVGQLLRSRGLKDLIWTTDLLKAVRGDLHLLILGEGPYQERLHRYRRLLQIEDRVHFLGHRDDVMHLLPHLDLFWQSGSQPGLSQAILEAMAAGTAVVASDTPGNRQLVSSGQTGYLVAPGDRGALARATNRLLEDTALARRMGQAGRQRVQRHFSAQAMVDRYIALYREVLI